MGLNEFLSAILEQASYGAARQDQPMFRQDPGPLTTSTPTSGPMQAVMTGNAPDSIDQTREAINQSLGNVNQEAVQRKISIEEIRRAIAERRPIQLGANDTVEGGKFSFSRGGTTLAPSSEDAVAQLDLRDRIDVLRRRASDGMYREDEADAAYKGILGQELPYLSKLAEVSGNKKLAKSQAMQAMVEKQKLDQEKDTTKYDKVLESFAKNREKLRRTFASDPRSLEIPTKMTNEAGQEITLGAKERRAAMERAADKKALEMALLAVPERYRDRILEDSGADVSREYAPQATPPVTTSSGASTKTTTSSGEDDGAGIGTYALGAAGLIAAVLGGRKGAKMLKARKGVKGLPAVIPGAVTASKAASKAKIPEVIYSSGPKEALRIEDARALFNLGEGKNFKVKGSDAATLRAMVKNGQFDADTMSRLRGLPAPEARDQKLQEFLMQMMEINR